MKERTIKTNRIDIDAKKKITWDQNLWRQIYTERWSVVVKILEKEKRG